MRGEGGSRGPGRQVPAPGGPQARHSVKGRGRHGTHRGSISTGHSWEAWFTQGTLEQTRDPVSPGVTSSLGSPTLYLPPRALLNISAQRTFVEMDAQSHGSF